MNCGITQMQIDDHVRHLLRNQVHAEVAMWNHVQALTCHDVNVHIQYKVHPVVRDQIWAKICDQVWEFPQ
jgi:hypothetical protein